MMDSGTRALFTAYLAEGCFGMFNFTLEHEVVGFIGGAVKVSQFYFKSSKVKYLE